MRLLGLLIILASVLAPLFAFQQLALVHPSAAIIGQYLGVVALIVMAFGQLLATRLSVIEWVFGPLDKTYVLHKWLGIAAVVTMLLHDNVGAEIKNLGPKGTFADLGEELGELGMNGVLILIGISLALFIPYNWWRWTHKLIGAFFVLSALHFAMVDKPFSTTDPLGLYVLAFCLMGVLSYAFTLLPMRLRPKYAYTVSNIAPSGDAVAITLTPSAAPLRHRAGQFAFFSFSKSRLHEVHPFTISSAPDKDGTLRLTVKALGDYTKRLGANLTVGTEVAVQGPFGRFGARGKAPQVWVGAGIGVTPFAALMAAWEEDQAPVDMFYVYRDAKSAAHLDELKARAAQLSNVTLHCIETHNGKRPDAEMIAQMATHPLKNAKVLYCGPAGLRDALSKDLRAHGVSRRRFHYEEFEIRSDFWPLDRINVPAKAWIAKLGF